MQVIEGEKVLHSERQFGRVTRTYGFAAGRGRRHGADEIQQWRTGAFAA
jgi:hypothetical protein